MQADKPPFNAIFKTALVKAGKVAFLVTAYVILGGFVLDGEYKWLFSAGVFFLIIFAAGLIAECWRPGKIRRGRSRPEA
jgi:hypothetical protein